MHKTSSPYLKQLFKGEIEWKPYSIKSLALAQKSDKIIFLHIGYIGNIEERERAYELFSDDRVVGIINENFIPIAIDLEDVPEALLVGMDLLVITEQHYSIPINVFSLPNGEPFTSFSNISAEEFLNLANNVIYSFHQKRELLFKAGKYISNRLDGTAIILKKEKPYPITEKLLHAYVRSWVSRSIANKKRERKSPYTINSRYYVFLLKYSVRYNNTEFLEYLNDALYRVYHSAIFDPIDGGLFSQSTNTTFKEPLYEKHLSENIQAAVLFSFGYKYFRDGNFKDASLRILSFIENCFKIEGMGYATAITLNKRAYLSSYYKYSLTELIKAFPADYLRIARILGMNLQEEENLQQTIFNTKNYSGLTTEELSKLKEIRHKKAKELISDSRVITAYNVMYASSLCLIYNNLEEQSTELTDRAEWIVDIILKRQKAGEIQLYRYISANNKEHKKAQLLDYAFFLNSLLNIYRYKQSQKYEKLISRYTAYILLNYYQSHNGMFSKTARSEEITPYKRESIIDYIRFSANSVMARNLLILHKIQKDDFYLEAFRQQLYNIAPHLIGTGPLMVGWALQILNYLTNRSDED